MAEKVKNRLHDMLGTIKERLLEYEPDADVSVIDRAFETASKIYDSRTTPDGRLVIEHFTEVGLALTDYHLESDVISGAILRACIMYGSTAKDIEERFGYTIRELVELLDQLGILRFSNSEEEQTQQLRQMFVAMARNVGVIMIELGNHLVFMRHADSIPEDQLRAFARQSLDIFAPLAHRLGVSKLKSEMEDLCFKALYPEDFRRLNRMANRTHDAREEAVERIVSQLKDIFRERNLQVNISGRTKHLYSTYEKMHRQGKDLNELFDLAAVRVITNKVDECYSALAILHSMWSPVHEEFDDYIATPKGNGYKSIHTVVIAPNGQPVEVQIRTWEMHMTAEFGLAAHWQYKEKMIDGREPSDEIVRWIKDFTQKKMDASDAREHLRNVVIDPVDEKVFALTPRGRVIKLPAGATPLDFAYRIHTEVGHKCAGAKVNGRMAPIDSTIKNGDVVEIITKKQPKPSRDWLRVVVAPSTRAKIRQWFRNVDRDENISHGHSMLIRELERNGLRRKDLLEQIGHEKLLKTYNYKTEDDFFAALGCGDISLEGVVTRVRKEYKELIAREQNEPEQIKPRKRVSRGKKPQDIVAEGITGVMFSFAKCCLPVPGDKIVGFVTKTRGISVHRKNCPNIRPSIESGDRMIEVSWGDTRDHIYLADVVINSLNRVGLLKDIMAIISDSGVNIATMKTRSLPNSTSLINMRLEVSDLERLEYIVQRISSLEDVLSASRKI